jgi:hypothetical protein
METQVVYIILMNLKFRMFNSNKDLFHVPKPKKFDSSISLL